MRRLSHSTSLAACLALAGCLALSACSRGPKDSPAEKARPAWAYEREATSGPVSLFLRLDKLEATLSDRIELEEELVVNEGFEADFPEYLPEDFEGFSVVKLSEDHPAESTEAPSAFEGPQGAAGAPAAEAPSPAGGPAPEASAPPAGSAPSPVTPAKGAASDAGPSTASKGAAPGAAPAGIAAPAGPSAGSGPRVRRMKLILEPDRSGELMIAPLAVYFRTRGEKQESSFLTEEVKVTVKPLESVSSLEMRPPRGIYEAPVTAPGHSGAIWIAAGALGLSAVALAAWLWLRHPARAAPSTPSEEIAYESLRRLVAMNLIEKGQVELFFVILSSILRDYIERRFQVRAPERTSEEFLEEASRHEALIAHRGRLGEFLSLCDQVKFAQYEPVEAAIQGAFDVTKQFVSETTAHASQLR